jgi:uncharacterized protein
VADEALTYLLVDGENIDGALGGILSHRPDPAQRPRWQQLLEFVQREWERPVRGLFFINATRGLHASFAQALMAIGYRPIPLSGRMDEKVVDIAIQRTLDALVERDGNVLLASHDGDFEKHMTALSSGRARRIESSVSPSSSASRCATYRVSSCSIWRTMRGRSTSIFLA